MKLTSQQKFEALKICYKSHVDTLRFMTKIDFQIFGGYMTLQLVLGSWLSQNTLPTCFSQTGILFVDLALSFIACILLYNDYRRRKEVVDTLTNINQALGYTEPNIYIVGKTLMTETIFRPWAYFYILGIVVGLFGIVLIIFKNN